MNPTTPNNPPPAAAHTTVSAESKAQITLFPTVKATKGAAKALTWTELVAWLTDEKIHNGPKEALPLWVPATLKDSARGNENVQRVTLGVLDLDEITPADLSALHARLQGLALDYVYHSSYSHTPERPKFRFVVRLSRSVSVAEWPRVWGRLAEIAPAADESCKDATRGYFVPGHPEGAPWEAGSRAGGRALDVDALLPPPSAGASSALAAKFEGLDSAKAPREGVLTTYEDAIRSIETAREGEKHTKLRAASLRLGSLEREAGAPEGLAEAHVWRACRAALEANERAGGTVKSWSQAEETVRSGVRLAYANADAPGSAAPAGFFGRALKGSDFAAYQASRGPVPWVCEGLQVTEGRPVIVAARPGDGKTLIAQDLALAVANGGQALGQFACRAGRVIHLDFEQGERTTVRRYDRLRVGGAHGSTSAVELYSMPERHLASDGAEAALRVLCEGAALLIVDSLSAALPGENENDARIGEYLTTLTRVSLAAHCAIVVLHHYRKPAAQDGKDTDPRDMLRGSSAILSQAGAVWVLGGKPERDAPKTMTLIRQSQDATEHPDPFTIRITDAEGGGLRARAELKGAATAEKRAADEALVLRTRILTEIKAQADGLSRNRLQAAIGGREETLQVQLDALTVAGELVTEKVRGSVVYLTPSNAAQRVAAVAREDASALERKRAQREATQAAYLERVLAFVRERGGEGVDTALVQARCPGIAGLSAKKALEALHAEGRLQHIGPSVIGKDVYRAQAAE